LYINKHIYSHKAAQKKEKKTEQHKNSIIYII